MQLMSSFLNFTGAAYFNKNLYLKTHEFYLKYFSLPCIRKGYKTNYFVQQNIGI